MKYLVMEVHPAYAVVLDEEGRFLKVANFHYQVGQQLQAVEPLRQQAATVRLWPKMLGMAVAAAACAAIVYTGYYQPNYTEYGTVQIAINPQVELTLSKTDRVLEMQGLNQDGQQLIDTYEYHGKDRETATRELIERAVEMGYLAQGGDVWITVYSSDEVWQQEELKAIDDEMAPYREYIQVEVTTEQQRGQTQAVPQSTVMPHPTGTPLPTATPAPTPAPTPTASPMPTVAPTAVPQPTAVPAAPPPTAPPAPTAAPQPLPSDDDDDDDHDDDQDDQDDQDDHNDDQDDDNDD